MGKSLLGCFLSQIIDNTSMQVTVFKEIPEIALAYQYGSSLESAKKDPNDIDIGILLNCEVMAERRFEILEKIARTLQKEHNKEIDVAVMNQASPMLCYQVLKKGKLIYGDKKVAKEFLVRTLTRYFDYLFMHQYFVDRMKKRLGVEN